MKIITHNIDFQRFWEVLTRSVFQKKILLLVVIFLFGVGFLLNLSASKNNLRIPSFEKVVSKDTIRGNQPKIDIKVNKEYDENGNVIRYDSSYSSSYYYSNKDFSVEEMDSIMNRFKPFFYNNYSSILDQSFDHFFFNDSLFFDDFYRDDFFERGFQSDHFPFEDMMRQFDSMKNEFFRRSMPAFPDKDQEEKGTQL